MSSYYYYYLLFVCIFCEFFVNISNRRFQFQINNVPDTLEYVWGFDTGEGWKSNQMSYERMQMIVGDIEKKIRSLTSEVLTDTEISILTRYFYLTDIYAGSIECFRPPASQYGLSSVIRVPPKSDNRHTSPELINMLICPKDKEQRLISFMIPCQSCSLAEIFEQIDNLSMASVTKIKCVSLHMNYIDYCVYLDYSTIVTVKRPLTQSQINNRAMKAIAGSPDAVVVICDLCANYSVNSAHCSRCLKMFPQKTRPARTSNKTAKKGADSVAHHTRSSIETVLEILSSDEDESDMNSTEASGIVEETERKDSMEMEMEIESEDIKLNSEETQSSETFEVPCRMIQVGSYKRVFASNVLVTSKDIRFCIEPCDAIGPATTATATDTEVAVITLPFPDAIKVVINFSLIQPVIMVLATSKFCNQTRMSLHMTDTIYNYCSVSKIEPFKRLIFFVKPDIINDAFIANFKKLVPKHKLEHISDDELAKVLLKVSKTEDIPKAKTSTRSNKNGPSRVAQLLSYQSLAGKMSITTMDYTCLASDQFLNDTIIDFYIDHSLRMNLDEDGLKKIHLFSTFFYQRLISKKSDFIHRSQMENLSADEKRHFRVKKWTKNINIFEKDFVFIPINDSSHWYLIVICFPNLDGCRTMDKDEPYDTSKDKEILQHLKAAAAAAAAAASQETKEMKETPLAASNNSAPSLDSGDVDRDEAEAANDSDIDQDVQDNSTLPPELKPIKQPCILIFDSLSIPGSKNRVIATLRGYLKCEYYSKFQVARNFTKDSMPGYSVKVPQQTNYTDCGLYVLQYIESFLTNPIKDFRKPIKGLENWFEEIVVTGKREFIANLLREKIEQFNGENLSLIPDISFPTRNGELIPDENSTITEAAKPPLDADTMPENGNENESQPHVEAQPVLKAELEPEPEPMPELEPEPEPDPEALLETAVRSIMDTSE